MRSIGSTLHPDKLTGSPGLSYEAAGCVGGQVWNARTSKVFQVQKATADVLASGIPGDQTQKSSMEGAMRDAKH